MGERKKPTGRVDMHGIDEKYMDDIRAAAGEAIVNDPGLKKLMPKDAPEEEPGDHEEYEARKSALEDAYTRVCKRLHSLNEEYRKAGRTSLKSEIEALQRKKRDIERKLRI
jgi:hypothetical protein